MSRMLIPSPGECVLFDDPDFSEADQTIRLELDGVHYKLDLSTKNARMLRDYLQPFLQVNHIGEYNCGTRGFGTCCGEAAAAGVPAPSRHSPRFLRSTSCV